MLVVIFSYCNKMFSELYSESKLPLGEWKQVRYECAIGEERSTLPAICWSSSELFSLRLLSCAARVVC